MFQEVNGIRIYYEQYGQGRPIILLHGNGENHKIFNKLINQLQKRYTVYAIDSRGHGKSTKVKELDYETMTEDIVAFIRTLKLEKPILYGFSDGGIMGIILASKYPGLLSKLIISGANLNPAGVKEKDMKLFRLIYRITKSIKFLMMLTQPNIHEEELNKIDIPTLVLAGSNDLIKEEHTRLIANKIPGSTLRILEGENHMSYVVHSPKLYDIINPFLNN
jgi:pimeloyl-ACP methyl ester carboxylesterase